MCENSAKWLPLSTADSYAPAPVAYFIDPATGVYQPPAGKQGSVPRFGYLLPPVAVSAFQINAPAWVGENADGINRGISRYLAALCHSLGDSAMDWLQDFIDIPRFSSGRAGNGSSRILRPPLNR